MKKLIERYKIESFVFENEKIYVQSFIKENKSKNDSTYINTFTLTIVDLKDIIKETKKTFHYITQISNKPIKRFLSERIDSEYKNWIDIWCKELKYDK